MMPPGERVAAAKGWKCFLFPAWSCLTQCNLYIIQVHTLRGWQSTQMLCCVRIAYIQCAAWASWCMLNDCAFRRECIFTHGDRWECVRGEKCETQLDGRYTLDDVHTLPLALGQRSSHTTHRPLPPPPPFSSLLPPHRSAPPSLSFPTLHHQSRCDMRWRIWASVSLCVVEGNDADSTAKKYESPRLRLWVCACAKMIKWEGEYRCAVVWPHCFLLSSLLDMPGFSFYPECAGEPWTSSNTTPHTHTHTHRAWG